MGGGVAMYAFSGPPQPVEISYRGIWYRGELLGWRTEPDGRCVARVRCVVGKLRHSAWVGLADLRLPEPGAPDVANPPIDLGPPTAPRASSPDRPAPDAPPATAAVRPVPRIPAAPRSYLATPRPPAPLAEHDTRPHELLPRRTARSRPHPDGRPLPPPPRSYQQPVDRPLPEGSYSNA